MMRAASITRSFADAADTITLDEDTRHRRRMRMTSDNGIAFLLDLKDATLLRHGDGLVLSDGRVIEVHAVPEPLYEVRGRDARHLTQLAWQLGNRHLPTQICDGFLLIRQDHVIHDLLLGLGARVEPVTKPFDPEHGAYAHRGHDVAHGHNHD